MNRVVTRLGFTTLALVAGSVAFAQSSTTGSVTGTVTDAAGAPVAGATVTLSSAQITRTATTAADGTFRLGLLNPGEWSVSITKAGMAPVKQKVNVSTNQVTPLTVKLSKEAEKVVEVVAAQVGLDPTTVQTGLNVPLDTISSVPVGRDFSTLIQLAPGVADSGRMGGYSIAGASGIENSFVVDGLATTDMRKGYQGAIIPTDFVDQFEVQTGGLKPEYSALGGVVNAVTKAGSNQFAGSAWVTWDARALEVPGKRTNYARQANAQNRYDIGFTAGGAIIKDKLFYFVGGNYQKVQDAPGSGTSVNNLGLSSSQYDDTLNNVYGKLNWFITPDQQLTGAFQSYDRKFGQDTFYSLWGSSNTALKSENKIQNYTLNYDWTINPSLMLSVKVGKAQFESPQVPQGSTALPLIQDAVAFNTWYPNAAGAAAGAYYVYGGVGQYTAADKYTSDQFKADLSWFLGSHSLKFGVNTNKAVYSTRITQSGGGFIFTVDGAATASSITATYYNNDGKVTAKYNGAYIQDTWEAVTGLRVIFGGRYDTVDVKQFSGITVFKFNDFKNQFQPRVSATWDMNNDGRSKVSLSYARSIEMPPMYGVMRNGGSEVYTAAIFDGSVHPGNFTYNTSNGSFALTGTPDSINNYSGGFTLPPVAEGTRLNTRDEWMLGFDRVLADGWNGGIHVKYRDLKEGMEDGVPCYSNGLSIVPGFGYVQGYGANGYPDAILWNPGHYVKYTRLDGTVIQGDNLPFPRIINKYTSADVTLERKTANSYLNFSYTWSRLEGNYEGLGQSSNGQDEANITSTFDFPAYIGYGPLPLDRTHILKFFGNRTFDLGPGQLNVGVRYQYLSGTPKTGFDDGSVTNGFAPGFDTKNFVYFTSGQSVVPNIGRAALVGNANYNSSTRTWTGTPAQLAAVTPYHQFLGFAAYGGAVPYNYEYGNLGRTPNQQTVDLNLNYAWKVSAGIKVTPSVDVFNLFNSRPATIYEGRAINSAGNGRVAYNQELAWLEGRRYRFGVKVNF